MSSFATSWSMRERVAPTPLHDGLFLQLAPMDGVTDWVHRELITDQAGGHSGISLCASEFVRVTRDVVTETVILRHCPELRHGGRTRSGVPVYVQLLGGKPEPVAETAARAADLGALGIDLNFGCPAKTVNKHDGGATLLREPKRVEQVVAAVRQAVPAAIAVTVKIRTGWSDSDDIETLAIAAEAGGASWLAVHGRTRAQLYRPPVNWPAIGRARVAVQIPVIANGDLNTADDVLACARQSGCFAFMIGRGVMGRPNLFRLIRGWDQAELRPQELTALVIDYGERLVASGRLPRKALGRVKQWLRLGAPAFDWIHALFDRVKVSSDLATATATLERYTTDLPARVPHRGSRTGSEASC